MVSRWLNQLSEEFNHDIDRLSRGAELLIHHASVSGGEFLIEKSSKPQNKITGEDDVINSVATFFPTLENLAERYSLEYRATYSPSLVEVLSTLCSERRIKLPDSNDAGIQVFRSITGFVGTGVKVILRRCYEVNEEGDIKARDVSVASWQLFNRPLLIEW